MTTVALGMRRAPWTDLLAKDLYAPGAGNDVAAIDRHIREVQEALADSSAITYRETLIADTVKALADEWRADTQFESSLTIITAHPAYRAVIDLGAEVLPVLLNELRRNPEPWFAALREITGEDPVRVNQRGNMRAMADAWLHWGRERRLIR